MPQGEHGVPDAGAGCAPQWGGLAAVGVFVCAAGCFAGFGSDRFLTRLENKMPAGHLVQVHNGRGTCGYRANKSSRCRQRQPTGRLADQESPDFSPGRMSNHPTLLNDLPGCNPGMGWELRDCHFGRLSGMLRRFFSFLGVLCTRSSPSLTLQGRVQLM